MTNEQVCSDIRKRCKTESECKIYNRVTPKMKQPHFSRKLLDIERNIARPVTVVKFFGKFGYVGEWNNFERK